MRHVQARLRPQHIAVGLFTLLSATLGTPADIFEWEYIDPLQPQLGKQESTTLVPDGAGVDAVPNASYGFLDLSKAYFINADLSGTNWARGNATNADFSYADLSGASFSRGAILTDANLSGANLTDARLSATELTNTDFSGAVIEGTDFNGATTLGFTQTQLQSTLSFQNNDLSGIGLSSNNLAGWDLANQNLSNARFVDTTLAGTDFTGSTISGVSFRSTTDTGFTQLQFQSTTNYQNGDLRNLDLRYNDLSGWDFAGKNLAGTNFITTDLTGTDFSGADLSDVSFGGNPPFETPATLSNAIFTGSIINRANLSENIDSGFTQAQLQSTANYQNGDLRGINFERNDMTGWDLTDQDLGGTNLRVTNLTDADLTGADLTDADLLAATLLNANLSGAVISGANLIGTPNRGLTEAQFQSTASYQNRDLRRLIMGRTDLTGWDFSDLDLSGAHFGSKSFYVDSGLNATDYSGSDLRGANFEYSEMVGANLAGSNLTDARFFSANLSNANLESADARGAVSMPYNVTANHRNFIATDGRVDGLELLVGETMRFWDYDGDTPIPILIQQSWDTDNEAHIRMVFEDPDWGSTILFDASVGTAYLGGTLELAMKLDDGLTPTDLLGATFQLFDWTGVSIVGGFDAFVVDPAWFGAGLSIDRSLLMTTGEVRVVPLIGDLDGDGFVGVDDLNLLLANWNLGVTPGDLLSGDITGDGFIGVDDLNVLLVTWNAGSPPPAEVLALVPEPGGAAVLVLGGLAALWRRAG